MTLLELIREDVGDLTQRGREWWGCCPFHSEKTASFSVNEEKGLYYCFGCGAKGDAIGYVRATRGLSFRDACATLGLHHKLTPRHENNTHSESVNGKPAPSADLRGNLIQSAWEDLAETGEHLRDAWAFFRLRESAMTQAARRMPDLYGDEDWDDVDGEWARLEDASARFEDAYQRLLARGEPETADEKEGGAR